MCHIFFFFQNSVVTEKPTRGAPIKLLNCIILDGGLMGDFIIFFIALIDARRELMVQKLDRVSLDVNQ